SKNSRRNFANAARSSGRRAGTSSPPEYMPGRPDSTMPRAPCAGAASIAARSAATSPGSRALTGGRARRGSRMESWRMGSSMFIPGARDEERGARVGLEVWMGLLDQDESVSVGVRLDERIAQSDRSFPSPLDPRPSLERFIPLILHRIRD